MSHTTKFDGALGLDRIYSPILFRVQTMSTIPYYKATLVLPGTLPFALSGIFVDYSLLQLMFGHVPVDCSARAVSWRVGST